MPTNNESANNLALDDTAAYEFIEYKRQQLAEVIKQTVEDHPAVKLRRLAHVVPIVAQALQQQP